MSFKLINLILFVCSLCTIEATVSDKRLCVDEKCSAPISKAKTVLSYAAPDIGYLSFQAGEVITIYSKEAGNNLDLWGAEINGKRGYIPKTFVRESKLLNAPSLLVDTEFHSVKVPSIEPNQPEALVIDGTTLYDDIAPSTTEHVLPVTATTVPQNKAPNTDSEFVEASKKEELKQEEGKSQDDEDDIDIEDDEEDDDDDDFDDEEEEESDDVDSKVSNEDKVPSSNLFETIDKSSNEKEPETFDTSSVNNIFTGSNETKHDIKDGHESVKQTDTLIDKEYNNITENKDNVFINRELPLQDQVSVENQQNSEKVESFPKVGLPLSLDSVVHLKEDTNTEQKTYVQDSDTKVPDILPNSEFSGSTPSPDSVTPTALPLFFHNSLGSAQPYSGQVATDDIPVTTPMPTESPSIVSENEKLVPQDSSDFKDSVRESLLKDDTGNIGLPASSKIDTEFIDSKESSELNKPEIIETKENNMYGETENLYNIHVEPLVPESNISSLLSNDIKKDNVFSKKDQSIPNANVVNDNDNIDYDKQIHVASDTTTETVKVEESSTEEAPSGFFSYFGSSPSELTTEPSIIVNTQEDNKVIKEQQVGDPSNEYKPPINVDETTELPQIDIHEVTDQPGSNEINREGVPEQTTESSLDAASDNIQQTTETTRTHQFYTEAAVDVEETSEEGWFEYIWSMFGSTKEESIYAEDVPIYKYVEKEDDVLLSHFTSHGSCSANDDHCHSHTHSYEKPDADMLHSDDETSGGLFDFLEFNDTIIIVALSGACVVLFLWGYMIIEKMRKEGPLVGKINKLEHNLLILSKENEVLTSKLDDMKSNTQEINENISSEMVLEIQKELDDSNNVRASLEEQIQSLEKELENSTEVGLELNRMLSDVLSSQNGSDTVMANIEQLQKQLVEQQATINSVNSKLNEKDTENHELQLDLEINNKKVVDLQAELEKMMMNLLKTEEEKEMAVSKSEAEITELRTSFLKIKASSGVEVTKSAKELADLKQQLIDVQRKFDLKTKEYTLLRESLSESDSNKSVLDRSSLQAELQQLQQDNKSLNERLAHDQVIMKNFEGQVAFIANENHTLKKRYEDADKEKLEALTKLEVLSTYFKEKEAALQRELSKHEAMWSEKQGEASTTTERIKFMQEEIQNFKAQVASLQQEIVSQEVSLKSQISVLEKKAHENWVSARQAERKIEDARQEAAQLRNRLTLRERSLNEEKSQNRLQSPLEANGVDHLSPMHVNDTTASPPLLYGTREHLTTSPPIPGLPPGFPMPPPGVPFMPPPLPGMPPFMPPPPSMFPGDHRPPPLGRMSSPPLNSRYTPDSRVYSPYDRRSPSPTDDEYYDRDSFYNQRSKRGNSRRSGYSSASNSNESLDKLDRQHSKV